MKDKLVIPIHSILDVITNSSSELFIIDENKGIETVEEAVKCAYEKYGAVYDVHGGPNVYIGDPSWYMDTNFNLYEDEDIIKWLEMKGYKIVRPEKVNEQEAIIVEWERGTMDQQFVDEIAELFETEVINN